MAALGPARVRALVEALVDTLADLHAVVPREVGLADFGRPDGYNERQVRRWKRQLDGSRSRAVPGIDELAARLSAAVPPISRAAIVHGDYRLDNVMADGCRVRAVLDWEMSTLGDPLADLALMLMYAGRELPAIDGPARSPLPYPATLAPTSWSTGTPPGPAGTSATCAGTSRSRTSNSP